MKKAFTIISLLTILSLFANQSFASNLMVDVSHYNDSELLTLVQNEQMHFRANNNASKKSLSNVTFNGITNMVKITTEEIIASLEILNEKGDIEFILPIGSKILNIDLLDFTKGTYTINLKMQSSDNKLVSSTMVKTF